jgi:Na+-transporting NADH:ubiquinone oxidoreductase subunit F
MYTILIATLLVGVLCAVLAALLLVAERTLVNYGPCSVDINKGSRTFEVKGGRSLLASLIDAGVFIPSACGGRGTCAYCKVRAVEGLGPVAPTEVSLLTEEEIAESVRLSCQVKVRNDIAIAIPEELLSVREFRAEVEAMTDLTHDIKLVRLRLIEPATIEFEPGQYVQLMAPAYGSNPEPVYRAYSIASPPSDSGHIELIIRLAPGGICTTWVFTILKDGDEVRFNGPYGEFRLSDTDAEMVWIAGGSGMAPFWSIVRHMRERGIERPCTYFFGAVGQRDLFLVDELREMEKALPGFRFVPALSGAENDGWAGETGLITEVVARHLSDGASTEGYLCGSGGMIDASVKVLTAKGIPEERIYYDKFT